MANNTYPNDDYEYRIDLNPLLDTGKGVLFMGLLEHIYESTHKSNYYEVINGAYDKR